MGYNLKNVRNEKSTLKKSKWPSLGLLALKSKFIRQFYFTGKFRGFVWKMVLKNKVLPSNNIFRTNFTIFKKPSQNLIF